MNMTIIQYTGRYVSLIEALAGRHPGKQFPVVAAAVMLIDEQGKKQCDIAHEALYNDNHNSLNL